MRLQTIYKADINRDINGVIKVAQNDERSAQQELSEYVITKELRKHFSTFFSNYEKSIYTPTDKIGVWISGFFGSGKSHFLKMLSYLLSNQTVAGKPSIEYFADKFDDPMMIAQIEQCVKIPTDTILFNIDSKSPINKDKTAILRTFAKVFYEHKGFYGDDLKVAKLEQFIDKSGKTDDFKDAFERINGDSWENARDAFAFFEDDIVNALVESLGMSETSARNWFNGEESAELSIEQLVREIKEYIDEKGKDYRLLFMVDEVGQYIGSDSDLMLNLQTLVEEIGTKCGGRVWVMVTSQEAIDSITKISGNDFSKIQGRFNTRLSLSSSSVDEVIRKRILAKNETADAMLRDSYSRNNAVLKNLFVFSGAVLDLKGYAGEEEFVETYPFVPYQFRLMQNVLAQIRKHGNSGKHLSGGERSMLSGFQEAAQALNEKDENALIPFYLFYNTVHTFLESAIRRVIDRCQSATDTGNGVEQYDVEVLKLLYLVRYVDDIRANLDNITVLMIDDIRADKIIMRQKIQGSLDRLVSQNYISRNGDTYTFLTDDEQDIAREIKETPVDSALITQSIAQTIFGDIYINKKFRYGNRYDFVFDKKIDEAMIGQQLGAICLHFITVASEIYSTDDAAFLMQSAAGNEVIIVLSDAYPYFEELENAMKIRRYVMGKNTVQLPEAIQGIIRGRQQQASEYEKRAKEYISRSIAEGRIYVAGEKLNLKISSVKDRIDIALSQLIENVYSKLNYVRKNYDSDMDIMSVLSGGNGQQQLEGTEKPNSEAIYEIEQYLNVQEIKHLSTSMGDVQKKFSGIPFGWREMDIAVLIAEMIADKKIEIRYAGSVILPNDKKIPDYLRKKSEIDKVIVQKKSVISQTVLKSTREFLREYFDIMDIPTDGDDVVLFAIDKFTEQKKSLSELLANEYSTKNYPDKSLVEEGINLTDELLSKKNDALLLLKKMNEMVDDFLDFGDDFQRVKAFFKNQRIIFDKAAEKLLEMEQEKEYLQNEPQAMKILSDIRGILTSRNPYKRISELPDYIHDIDRLYNELLAEKRGEVLSDIQAAMAEIHQTASPKQSDVVSRADSALTAKRDIANNTSTMTALDAMKIQIASLRQQFIRQLVVVETPNVKTVTASRSSICHTAKIQNDEDIEAYLDQMRKTLKEKLSGNDVLHII